MPKTYELRTFNDLLKIPADRRAACFLDVEYSLALHEVAFADVKDAPAFTIRGWKDDGKHDVVLHDQQGNELLALEVTPL